MNGRALLVIGVAVAAAVLWSGSLRRQERAIHASGASVKSDSAVQSATDVNGCEGNCRGHQAGYDWAQAHSIADEHECDFAGAQSTFKGGCRAYLLNEQKRREPVAVSSGPIDDDEDRDLDTGGGDDDDR